MKALTKKQLEELGFTVKERQLKKGLKIDIYWDGCYSDYIGSYEKYPTFQYIIGNVIREVQNESDRLWKNRLMERLLGDREPTVYCDM
jgi:hypothetical protein